MSKTMKALVIILVLAVFGLGGALAYPYAKKLYTSTNPTKTPTPTSSTTTSTPTAAVSVVTDTGVTWITPVKLGDLTLIKNAPDTDVASSEYYKVADLQSGGSIVMAISQFDGPAFYPATFRFKKDKDGNYSYLLNHSYEKSWQKAQEYLNASTNIDSAITYKSLSVPAFLTEQDETFSTSIDQGLFSSLSENGQTAPQKFLSTEYGDVYRGFVKGAQEISNTSLYLKMADSTFKQITPKVDFQTDDEIALVTWKDSTKNSAKYTLEGYTGCSAHSTFNTVINVSNISSRLTETGTTNSGEKIYTVAKNDPVMTAAYENYQVGRTENILTLEQFVAQKPVFVYKDKFNQYIIFTGREFAGLAECGKPVIYLYPTKDTQVSVKVGAKITKSDPEYGNGWVNVSASPNGKLKVDGSLYDSLFWEGLGYGNYPTIDQGFVVKKDDLKATLESQLAQLGLNAKEFADFMDFWWPKMPQTPYTRLTWFGTSQMNELAPLTVSPKPDTMIRIFLDFAGLEKPINIQPQKLSAPMRNGFTLVEWGGLLKGK